MFGTTKHTAYGSLEPYTPQEPMRKLIAENNLLLMALSRFEIALGFGTKTVAQVCADNGVDTSTFLAVANFLSDRPYERFEISLPSLVKYLKNAHTYFLDFILPEIRRKLIASIDCSNPANVGFLILRFYDGYVEVVRRHMEYENSHVFNYVDHLIKGINPGGYHISDFEHVHRPIASKLNELKDIFICHYAGSGARVDSLNSALFDIIICEQDLLGHCMVEDRIFVPAVQTLEQEVTKRAEPTSNVESKTPTPTGDILTEREKEIVRCVTRGMSNKEIADKLFLSIHTVTTHRRNINNKLQIHSTAALAIFAILNKLIDLSEVHV